VHVRTNCGISLMVLVWEFSGMRILWRLQLMDAIRHKKGWAGRTVQAMQVDILLAWLARIQQLIVFSRRPELSGACRSLMTQLRKYILAVDITELWHHEASWLSLLTVLISFLLYFSKPLLQFRIISRLYLNTAFQVRRQARLLVHAALQALVLWLLMI